MADDTPKWGLALETAVDVVQNRMEYLDARFREYNAAMMEALGEIGSRGGGSAVDVGGGGGGTPDAGLGVPEIPEATVEMGSAPTLTASYRDPGGFNGDLRGLEALLQAIESDSSGFPDPPVPLDVTLPSRPQLNFGAAPSKPNVDMAVVLPTAPSESMPELEALDAISIPAFTFPVLPDFNDQPPSTDGLQVPDVFVDWQDPEYRSELLDELVAWVRQHMQGGSGLPVAVEQALFGRARERDSAETQRAVQEAVDTWAARGFSMPPGMLNKQVNVAREDGRLKAAELNRDIMVEAAKWEIEGVRFAVQQGIAIEQLLSNIFNNMAQRIFEMGKLKIESQISVFNANIGLYNAKVQAFQVLAQVYKTKLEGALAKLQAYKTQIEAQQAIGQLNQQKVEVFRAKLQAMQTAVEIYVAQMRGAQTKVDIAKAQFDAYKTDVDAYSAKLGAEKLKVDIFDSEAKVEATKASIFEAQTRAYAATLQGIASKNSIKIQNAQANAEMARALIQKYSADLDRYKADVQASLTLYQADVQAFLADVEAWKSEAGLNISAAEMQARFADIATRTNIAYAEMKIKENELKITDANQKASIALEGSKAVGQYTAQLAAGAMSALNVSASVSGSGSQSNSISQSWSKSESKNYNYSY